MKIIGWLKKKEHFQTVLLCVMLVAMICAAAYLPMKDSIEIVDPSLPLSDGRSILVMPTDADINVIPDKYNCGAGGEMSTAGLGQTFPSMYFKASGEKNVIDFAYNNRNVTGTVSFENIDFSQYPVAVNNERNVERKIKLVFTNCIFDSFSTGVSASNISYEFNNCTIKSFYGSNAVFDRCLFGQGYNDALTPFQNVNVVNSYFCDMASDDPHSAGIHTDGTQMYGHQNAMVKDVSFYNCRFEIPAIQTSASAASINACIMIQLEYNDAQNVQIKNCKLNGGGYTIYAHTKSDQINLSNIKFENIEIGVAHLYDDIYPHVSEGVSFKNVEENNALYVGSVWKEDGKILLSVTNDTSRERILLVYANGTEYTYEIPACPEGKKLFGNFSDFPFDICVSVPEEDGYIVCYDVTETERKQIRFVNWTNKEIFCSLKDGETLEETSDNKSTAGIDTKQEPVGKEEHTVDIISQGACGENIKYTVSNDGVLRLYGKGATYDYHSLKCAPWYEYRGLIKEIEIQEGISILGNQLFRNLELVKTVKLPESVSIMRANVFIGCGSLSEICLPKTIKMIGNYSFCGTSLSLCIYNGTSEQRNDLVIGSHNERLQACLYK